MSDTPDPIDPEIAVTFQVRANQFMQYENNDLQFTLALRTLIHKSFANIDQRTQIAILRSEADRLSQQLPQTQGVTDE